MNKVIEERVSTRRPIQQIIGQAFFYGRRFFVNEHTLVPRPETELLVSTTLDLLKTVQNPKILDIGTGTGCIPLTLAMENENLVADSVDISLDTIETAKKNALFHNVFARVNFIHSNLFENVENEYNLIVSNPPYIPLKDKESLQVEVRDYDPPAALFTNDELGIEFYEKIILDSHNYLLPNGYLVFELGINQYTFVEKLLKDNNFTDIRVIKDFNSIERIIAAKIKC